MMATNGMMATVTNNDGIYIDEYTINEYKDSDYYVDKYNSDELYKYYHSMEYLEGLEALDDYVNNARYNEEFDLVDLHLNVSCKKGKGKKETKAKYAALPLLQQIQHFIKVEKKQCISEKKRMDSMYLHNKRVAKQADSVKYVNEDVDDVVLMKDGFLLGTNGERRQRA